MGGKGFLFLLQMRVITLGFSIIPGRGHMGANDDMREKRDKCWSNVFR